MAISRVMPRSGFVEEAFSATVVTEQLLKTRLGFGYANLGPDQLSVEPPQK